MNDAPDPKTSRRRAAHSGRATRRRHPDQPCLNCGDTTFGNYCPNCGQAKRDVAVSVRALVADVLEDQLILSRALPRTLAAIFLHPGFLTTEYINGRIVRYIAPFRLYLVASVLFFLLLSLIGIGTLDINASIDGVELDSVDAAAIAQLERDRMTVPVDSSARAAVEEAKRQLEAAADAMTGDTAVAPGAVATAEALRALARRLPETDTAQGAVPAGDSLLPGTGPAQESGGLQPWARGLEVNLGSDELSARILARTVQRFGHLPPGEAAREFLEEYLGYVPHTMFVLLPIFALLLKLLYVRRRRYYAEHFVFALHFHAFTFLTFVLMLLLPRGLLTLMLTGWIAIYLWFAMKRVYGQGFLRTTLKYWALCAAYGLALVIGLTGTFVVTLALL